MHVCSIHVINFHNLLAQQKASRFFNSNFQYLGAKTQISITSASVKRIMTIITPKHFKKCDMPDNFRIELNISIIDSIIDFSQKFNKKSTQLFHLVLQFIKNPINLTLDILLLLSIESATGRAGGHCPF